jgi:outer membrane protein TolC
MKKFFILLFIFFLYTPLWAKEEVVLTLEEAQGLALRDNRDILLKTEEVKKAKFKIAESRAGLLPSVSLTGGWTDTRGYYAKDTGQTSAGANAKLYLYRGGKTINTIKYNGFNLEVSKALLDKEKLEILLQVEKAFYTLLLAEEYSQLNKDILDNTRGYLDMINARYASGQASESDVLKIKESLSNVEAAFEIALNQIGAGQALLKDLLFLAEDVEIKPQGEFVYAEKEVAYDEAFLAAMKNRPEIRQYLAEEQAAKTNVEISRADNRPTIYASWDYYSRSHVLSTAGLNKNWNDYNVLGLTFSWPIFDGWATKAKVEQAIVDLKETQLAKEQTTKDIALELKKSYLDLKNAIAEIKSAEVQVHLYKDTFSVIESKYKEGITSSLDLDDAKLGYEVSLFNQKEAIYDYVLAKASFQKATGGL